jgi:hypothetical protein|tara:strand:- start:2803 stop:3093 length:291 start_codon:yes stop_codon:yes gene_type:complete
MGKNITLVIKTYKESGWLNNYKDGFVRSYMSDNDTEILETALSKNRIKYIEGDYLIIKDTYDNKIKALRTLSRIQKLKDNMNDIGFKVTVDVITEL